MANALNGIEQEQPGRMANEVTSRESEHDQSGRQPY
jgi:hypothetical protein